MEIKSELGARADYQKPLTLKNYLAYASGDAAGNIAFTMAGMFLTLYYTNVVGIEGAVIGTMFMVLRFLDAFTDLLMGQFIDSRPGWKMGKFRPIILWFFVPLLIINWLMYAAKLIFPDQPPEFYTVYMYVTYFLMGSVFYTIVNISYGAMVPSMTQVPSERAKLAGFRMYGASAMILVLSWAIAPVIRQYQDDPVALQSKLALTIGVISLVCGALYLFMIWGTVEQVKRDPKPVSIADSFRALRGNRPLQVLALSSVCMLSGVTVMQTLGSYVALYVQRDATFIAINSTAQILGLFVIAPLIPMLVRTIGKRKAYIIVSCFIYAGVAILWFGPLADMPWLGAVGFFVKGIGVFGVNTLMWALEADCVEYGEWKSGSRTEGSTYAVFSFCRKMGQALGGFLGGFALTWAGFSAAAVSQGAEVTDDVARTILFWAVALTALGTLVGQIVMIVYPLTEQRYLAIVDEVRARRKAQAEASAPVETTVDS